MRVLLGAFGDPGHAFPMLALGEALAARGHEVCLQTWRRWREPVERAGIAFAAAPEYQVFPTPERSLKPYEAAVRAAVETRPVVRDFQPDVAVSDVLTPAPALAAELEGVRTATLVPHLFPYPPPGFPPFSIGARLPRTRFGRSMWRRTDGLVARGLELGRREYNECRARLGLGPLPWPHTGMSRELTLVATFPQLEYPRSWPEWARVIGPLMWEPPGEHAVPPPGDGPVVLIAPSTAQDREERLLRAALAGLADEPVRVIAIAPRGEPTDPSPRAPRPRPAGDPLHEACGGETGTGGPAGEAPSNVVLVPWTSYAQTMPHCDVIVCHGGHGTLARALASGRPVVVCPAGGDMAENAARVDWGGVGVRLPPRFCTPLGVRLAVRRALASRGLRERAEALARWAAQHDGREHAAAEVERWAAEKRGGPCTHRAGALHQRVRT